MIYKSKSIGLNEFSSLGIRILSMKLTILLLLCFGQDTSKAQVYSNLDVHQCDSLIQANANNPNFVILDVRRPSEYIPQHLEGAINRNYYDTDFTDQLDTLNKEKTYLIHCKSGGRSGNTINEMANLEFNEVYNMLGGINAWNSATLPTTTDFAPKIMFLSDSIYPHEEVFIGEVDTIQLSITNRANDTLLFTSVNGPTNPEFEYEFNIDTILTGAADYSFNIFYTSMDENPDTAIYTIESNGGILSAIIFRNGKDQTSKIIKNTFASNIKIYPNPAIDYINICGIDRNEFEVMLFDNTGHKVYNRHFYSDINWIDLSGLDPGNYILSILTQDEIVSKRIQVSN